MTADREELERLVHELPDAQVPLVLADVRRHLRPVSERPWPPAWFGAAPGHGTSIGANADELLAEGFGQYR